MTDSRRVFLNNFNPQLSDSQKADFAAGKPVQTWIQIFRPGQWIHPRYGALKFTSKIFEGFVKNFKENVRKIDLAIDQEHKPEQGAAAWIKDLENRGSDRPEQGLWALVEWTKWGFQLVAEGVFKYLSGDFDYEWTDEESQRTYKNVLFGAALTNRPFIKGMSPINLSEFSKELEEDENVNAAILDLATDALKLREGNKVAKKTDDQLMKAKDGDLTPEELKRKQAMKKEEGGEGADEEKAEKAKGLRDRAKAVGLKEDATEDEITLAEKAATKDTMCDDCSWTGNQSQLKDGKCPQCEGTHLVPYSTGSSSQTEKLASMKKTLSERAVKVGLSEDARYQDIIGAEKKLTETIGNENLNRINMAQALKVSPETTWAELIAAATALVLKAGGADKIKSNASTESTSGGNGQGHMTPELKEIADLEIKLSEMKEKKGDASIIKLIEDNIATKKKLAEEKTKGAKEKISNMLKEHFRAGKLTAMERDKFSAILFADMEGGETAFTLSEKDGDKEKDVTHTLAEIVDTILKERPAIVELKEFAEKELTAPPADQDKGEEKEFAEAGEIGKRVAGNVTKSTKSSKKLAEEKDKK